MQVVLQMKILKELVELQWEPQFVLGKIITENPYNDKGGLIGFNEQNILVLDSSFEKKGIRVLNQLSQEG